MTTIDIQLEKLIGKAMDKVAEFHVEFAQDIAERVIRTTPYKTGFLRASWWASIGAPANGKGPNDKTENGGPTVARVNLVSVDFGPGETLYYLNGAAYAHFVHNGTSRMAARPWVANVVAAAQTIAAATAARIASEP